MKKIPPKENKKTRILAIGDIHGDRGLSEKLAKIAEKEKVDIVIMAGDLTLGNSKAKGIIAPFQKLQKKVLLIPGNHETPQTIDEFSQFYSNAKNIHGYSIREGEIGIFGAGEVDWFEKSPENSELFKLLEQGNKYLKQISKKIMVTHMHPKGSKAEIFGYPGSPAIERAIKKFKPNIAICSHLHEAGGLVEKIGKTTVINVSRSPTLFEI
jgi:hypothetical protein